MRQASTLRMKIRILVSLLFFGKTLALSPVDWNQDLSFTTAVNLSNQSLIDSDDIGYDETEDSLNPLHRYKRSGNKSNCLYNKEIGNNKI